MVQLALLLVGVVCAAVGVAILSVPAALVLIGVAVTVFALYWDFDR